MRHPVLPRRLLVLAGWPWLKHIHPCGLVCYTARPEAQCTCGQYTLRWEDKQA